MLFIKLRESRLRDTVQFDLSPVIRFNELKQLWVIGYRTQGYELSFIDHVNVTSMPIEHLHIHMKRHFSDGNATLATFMQTLDKLKTVDIMNSGKLHALSDYAQIYASIPTSAPVNSVSLRHFQSRIREFKTIQIFDLKSVFPRNFANTVRYLDLSNNYLEGLKGGIISTLPKLKYLDLSHNFFII